VIRQILLSDLRSLEEFFQSAMTSEDHRADTFSVVPYYIATDDYYRGFAKFDDSGRILSACFIRELVEQKTQVLDFIVSRTGISIFKNRVGEVVDYAIRFGEQKGIYRFYTFLTDDMLNTVDVLKKKNSIFTWRERYDTYVDEVIEPECFSQYYLHWVYLMNTTIRKQRKIVRHHHLKPKYYAKITVL